MFVPDVTRINRTALHRKATFNEYPVNPLGRASTALEVINPRLELPWPRVHHKLRYRRTWDAYVCVPNVADSATIVCFCRSLFTQHVRQGGNLGTP